jgi:hypothetical protein
VLGRLPTLQVRRHASKAQLFRHSSMIAV